MHTPEFQKLGAGRRRYSDEFKRKVVAACFEPGVSTAALALANGLNANLLRRWVVESCAPSDSPRFKQASALMAARSLLTSSRLLGHEDSIYMRIPRIISSSGAC